MKITFRQYDFDKIVENFGFGGEVYSASGADDFVGTYGGLESLGFFESIEGSSEMPNNFTSPETIDNNTLYTLDSQYNIPDACHYWDQPIGWGYLYFLQFGSHVCAAIDSKCCSLIKIKV